MPENGWSALTLSDRYSAVGNPYSQKMVLGGIATHVNG
jgi:hypothetical protein